MLREAEEFAAEEEAEHRRVEARQGLSTFVVEDNDSHRRAGDNDGTISGTFTEAEDSADMHLLAESSPSRKAQPTLVLVAGRLRQSANALVEESDGQKRARTHEEL